MVERAVVDAYLRLVADGVLGQLVPTETRLLPVEVTGRAERLLAIAAGRTGNVLARPMPEGVVDHDAGRHLIAP
ncbi:MAG: hypothetical protein H0V33_04935, partial [Acidimicrobiia bacterium]|nr:hypothetical protein [Acidimicrobiia bacterium]